MISKKITRVIIITAIAFLVITGILVGAIFLHSGVSSDVQGPEFILSIVVIGGVVVLLVTLALTAVVFAGIDLTDRTQALGLPEGSVRSVIALSLILLFAIVSIFMYNNLSSTGKIVSTPPLSQEQRDQFKKGIASAQYLFDQPSGTAADPKDQKYVVYYRDVANPASEDFAKQLLAILATLVTAVSSFYFGAKTANTSGGQGQAHATPVIRGVNPAKVVRGTSPKLEVTGDGLDLIKEVKITFGGRQILATSVMSNASSITCQLAVDADAPVGVWDVIATDGTGVQAKLAGGLTVA